MATNTAEERHGAAVKRVVEGVLFAWGDARRVRLG
jgi:hypothetical protein